LKLPVAVKAAGPATGEVEALNLATGKVEWDTKVPDLPVGAATVSNDLVFTTLYHGVPVALNRSTGAIADALKRVTQDISINRPIRWKQARLPDTMGYWPRSTRRAAQPWRAARTRAPARPGLRGSHLALASARRSTERTAQKSSIDKGICTGLRRRHRFGQRVYAAPKGPASYRGDTPKMTRDSRRSGSVEALRAP
jgi:hypothetical protein